MFRVLKRAFRKSPKRDVIVHYNQLVSGLSLRPGGQGFPPATINMVPGYFHKKIEET